MVTLAVKDCDGREGMEADKVSKDVSDEALPLRSMPAAMVADRCCLTSVWEMISAHQEEVSFDPSHWGGRLIWVFSRGMMYA